MASPDGEGGGRPTAELLETLCGGEGERIALGEVVEVTEGRAHGLVVIVLGLPELIPMVGLSAILAAPILVVGVLQLVHGAEPRLPGWIRRRSIPRERAEGAIRRTLPLVRRLDALSRPRWHRLAVAGRLQGAVLVLMATLLAIPIPGVNILAASSVVATGLGILQRDGVLIVVACAAALLALAGFALVVTGAAGLLGALFEG